tara:strand:+ start:24 stop:521 length:498 start_codon:yes stop_codon:yes gene_type:complete
MELKEQIKKQLLKDKKEEAKKEIELNKNLKEITIYTLENNKICKSYIDYFNLNGVKYIEKDLKAHANIQAIVQTRQVPVIEIGANFLIQGRELSTPQKSIPIIRTLASPEYVEPLFEQKMIEMIKNLSFGMNRTMQNYSRQLAPILKILNSLTEEDTKEVKENNK